MTHTFVLWQTTSKVELWNILIEVTYMTLCSFYDKHTSSWLTIIFSSVTNSRTQYKRSFWVRMQSHCTPRCAGFFLARVISFCHQFFTERTPPCGGARMKCPIFHYRVRYT